MMDCYVILIHTEQPSTRLAAGAWHCLLTCLDAVAIQQSARQITRTSGVRFPFKLKANPSQWRSYNLEVVGTYRKGTSAFKGPAK